MTIGAIVEAKRNVSNRIQIRMRRSQTANIANVHMNIERIAPDPHKNTELA